MSLVAVVGAVVSGAGGASVASSREFAAPADPPSYVTWYYATPVPTPSPITGAYAAIGGALGAGNLYNTATNGFGSNGNRHLKHGLMLLHLLRRSRSGLVKRTRHWD